MKSPARLSIYGFLSLSLIGVQVVTIKDAKTSKNKIPTGDFILKCNDVMILLGPNDALKKVEKIKVYSFLEILFLQLYSVKSLNSHNDLKNAINGGVSWLKKAT